MIALAVEAEEVDVAFNLPDEVTLFIVQSLKERGVRIVRTRHEQNAVFMADAYSRSTGKPALCIVGPGPALAQTGNGFVTARRRRSQVLVLLGSIPRAARGAIKDFDSKRFAETVGAQYLEVRGESTVAEDIYEAFRRVRLQRGPVILKTPDPDGLLADVGSLWDYRPSRVLVRRPLEVDIDSTPIDEAAGMLVFGRRPVIVAGRGAVLADAHDEIVALADRIGALLATSVQARGYFRDHPRNIGIIGGFATDQAVELLAQADCVLAVGISLNIYQTGGGSISPQAPLIQIDSDADAIGQYTHANLAIVADARTAVGALNRALELADIAENSYWTSDAAQPQIAAAPQPPGQVQPGSDTHLHITGALAALEAVLPKDRVVIMDAGLFLFFIVDAISTPDPNSWIWSMDFGSIGLGLAMGIGTALARPDRHCVAFVGDGGLLMNIGELETAVREQIPLTIVVLNDGAYAAEALIMANNDMPEDLAVFRDVDFAAVARGFGARALTVRTLDDLADVAEEVSKRDGPLVIDVKIMQSDRHRAFPSAPATARNS
jgi:thiamine pyrophosphate-dependent acetolactate synthase large subunit-like protein